MIALERYIKGSGLMARIVRSASWVVVGYGAGQALRLASNLILTRILFPEAFGLMALITMVLIGLALFSDIGINPAVAQSKRGDDPEFLNTAWTLQVLRGGVLFAIACALAGPLGRFYDEPLLTEYLPVAAVSLLISGFNPTRIASAHRHLYLGRLTALDLTAQFITLVFMVVGAWLTGSVFVLVIGAVFQAVIYLGLTHVLLPGEKNRFRLNTTCMRELIGFGKWIFLSTACFFFTSQGDKALLGKFLSLENLGIYNIGFFLASFPLAIGMQVSHRILISVYRERPPSESVENFRKLSRMRHLASLGILSMISVVALAGPWLVDLLFDDRYALAGGIVVLVSVYKMVVGVGVTYDTVALSAGDSRLHFMYGAIRAVLQMLFLYIGVSMFGLVGGLLGVALAMICTHPVLVYLARAHGAWDPWHDAIWFTVAACAAATAVWINLDAVTAIAQM